MATTAEVGGAQALDAPSAGLTGDILAGLSSTRKWLPCALLYDGRGSRLFERICELEEYYPTRVESSILEAYAGDMARRVGERVALVEYGSGSSTKTRLLLDHLRDPAAYVPIDISCEQLRAAASRISHDYPDLKVMPLCADYHHPISLPEGGEEVGARVAFFPGSTIGNFNMWEAADFLSGVAATMGPGGALLIGVDLQKDAVVLERAYDDAGGVTAAFNLNVLSHLNRRWGANFNLERFSHRALYDHARGRIEMHLDAANDHAVTVEGRTFEFASGESILTEVSYKYTLDSFDLLARASGFEVEQVWCDDARHFSVQLLRVGAKPRRCSLK